MPINSRQKGARFERQLASKLREHGYDAHRTAQYCGNTGQAADVSGLPGIHIEAKHAEQMRLYEWMSQAKRDANAAGGKLLPAVFHKKNNAAILVTMELDSWIHLYREWQAGHDLEESFPATKRKGGGGKMTMTHKQPTQSQRIIEYIHDFGSITQFEAMKDLGVMRLASRISELRRDGYNITSRMETVKNRYGENCHIKRYSMAKEADA